ncbi:hypothetical protein AAG906_012521 [Vitis piasezkii]
MKEFGYKQSQGDHTLFIKHSALGGVTVLLVYVDDIIMTGNDEKEKHELKKRLATEFEIKELGKPKYFLDIEVAYSTQGIFISQQKYVTDLLAETGKIGCKLVSTPMDPNHKFGEAKEEPVVDKRMYQRLRLVLHYLNGNHRKGILFKKNNTLALEAYIDTDYAGSQVDQDQLVVLYFS